MSTYGHLRDLAGAFLEHPAFAIASTWRPRQSPQSTAQSIPLLLPTLNLSIRDDPVATQCSTYAISRLEAVLEQARSEAEEECQRVFAQTVEDFSQMDCLDDGEASNTCLSSVAAGIATRYERDIMRIRSEVLGQVQAAKNRRLGTQLSRDSSTLVSTRLPLPEPVPEPNGAFTEEVIEILRRAFEKCETLTRGEVKGLQSITKLNSKQASLPAEPIRTWFANQRQRRGRKPAPYLPPRRAPASQTPTKPLRNVSNSSASSSLISYSPTSSDKLHPELHGSTDAYSSLDFDRSAPFDSRMDVEDVPMPQLNSTSATVDYPRSLSIPTETGPFPVSSIPPAPTTAETDRFFSSQQFSSPLPPRSNEIYDVEYLPAQMPSTMNSDFLDQLQRTDPFLDDEFLKNVFGTLGVTQGGGLTLTMDSFQDEGEMSSGSGGSEGRGGSREEGQGSLMMDFARGGGAGGIGAPAGGFAFGW